MITKFTCAACGPEPVMTLAELRVHILTCPKHPLAAALGENRALRNVAQALVDWADVLGDLTPGDLVEPAAHARELLK